MRHLKRTVKLGRTSQHRDAMLANMVCSLIKYSRIKTTLAKAKAVRPLADKLVTLGKKGSLHHRRLAIAKIGQEDAVKKLFAEIAPRFKDRKGGYARVLKLGNRGTDAAPIALVEWVDFAPVVEAAPQDEAKKPAKKKAPKATGEKAEKKTEGDDKA